MAECPFSSCLPDVRALRGALRFAVVLSLLALILIGSGSAMAQDTTRDSSQGTASGADVTTDEVFRPLVEVLQDEAARNRLIEALQQRTTGESTGESTGDAATADVAVERVSPARQMAIWTARGAEIGVRESRQIMVSIVDSTESLMEADWSQFGATLRDFSVIVVVVLLFYAAARRLGRFGAWRLDRWVAAANGARAGGVVRMLLAVSALAVLEVILLAAAWGSGFGIALFGVGDRGEVLTHESLFLNAFLLIELTKIVLRMLFVGQYPHLSLLPINGEEAAYWNAWLARLVSFIGYGMLVIVPLVNMTVSFPAGRSVGLVIMFTAFLLAMIVILKNRARVCSQLAAVAASADIAFTRFLFTSLAHGWHWLALLYFGALAIVTVLRPEDALPFMASATVVSIAAVVVGMLLATLLSRLISRGIRLPLDKRAKFPLLETRLNAYVPQALKLMRLVILVLVLGVIVDAWTPFSLAAWFASDRGVWLVGVVFSVALIVAFAALFWLVAASWIEYRLNPVTGVGEPTARERTLLTLARNAIAIVLIVVTVMIVLSEIGVNIGPLLAGAGVLGLAIGFGAQTLVKDVITGLFIQLENAINVGEVVTLGGVTGTAERITIRSVGLRDLSGTYHLIPFSSVDRIANFNREFGYHVGEYGIAYREDPDEALVRLGEAFEELRENGEHGPKILAPLEVHGVTSLADSSVNVRVRIKTLPGAQFAVGRAFNRLVKRHFDAAGIEIPYPHQTIYFGEDKAGKAPPARLQMLYRRAKGPGDDHQRFENDPRAQQRIVERGDFDED